MTDDMADDDDRMEARRRWDALLADVEAEIRDEQRTEVLEERRREREASQRWRSLPPVRMRPGVPAERLTDDESALMDRNGY